MDHGRRSPAVEDASAGPSVGAPPRVGAPTFLEAFLAGLAAPTMAFTAAPRYLVPDPATGVSSAWHAVARHVSAAFDAQQRR